MRASNRPVITSADTAASAMTWMDPLAGIVGAAVIASWSYGLIRDTGAILLDMTPDQLMANNLRQAVESEGDQLADLHLWRLGPGHLGAIISVITTQARDPLYYRAKLARFRSLSHLTVEVLHKSGFRPLGATIPSSSQSTSMRTNRRTETTTCAPPLSIEVDFWNRSRRFLSRTRSLHMCG